jgi:hypothetical protein
MKQRQSPSTILNQQETNMIQRRQILKTAAASTVGISLFGAHAQQTFTLKFQTFVPATSNIWVRVITPWMKKVETESGGRIKFEGYTSSAPPAPRNVSAPDAPGQSQRNAKAPAPSR